MNLNDDTGTVTCDEHELHDVLAAALTRIITEVITDRIDGVPERLVIVPRDPKYFTPELVTKWEGKVTELFGMISTLDAEYHDDAEYTC